jgi:hypothetical protein
MNVTLNEAALRYLLEDPAGAVGLDLRRRSENVTALVRENVNKVMWRTPAAAEAVGYEIVTGDDGLVSIIGLRGAGRWADYLAAKEAREAVIFAPALDAGLDQ